MRRALAIAGVLALAGGAIGRAVCADDVPAEERVELMLETDRSTHYVGEAFSVAIYVAFDRTFFVESAIPTLLREMDVPLKVEAPWWDGLPGTIVLTDAAGGPFLRDRDGPSDTGGWTRGDRFALNDSVTDSEHFGTTRSRASAGPRKGKWGPTLTQHRVRRTFLATRPADLVLSAPTLRFSYATAFRDDLVAGRVPVDRKNVEIRGEPLTIHVIPLPSAGRPPEFRDAVGTFSVEAEVDRRNVEAGKPFRLTLRISGYADLPSVTPPRLDGLADFHVYGAIDDKGPKTRTIVFEVAALDARVKEFPSIPFTVFDPEPPAGYRVLRTTAIPLVVRGAPGATMPASTPRPPEPTPGLVQEPSFLWLSGTLVVLVIAVLTLRAKRRAQAAAAIDPATARALAAGDAFRARVASPDADASEAFAEFLAARLGSSAAAVIGPDLANRLVAAGATEDLADHASVTLERLVATRYARAGARAEAAEGLGALVDALARSLRPPGA